ncbi:MAG: YraN family protein [Woeseia sp.]
MPLPAHLIRGAEAETYALKWLQKRKLRCLARNVRSRFGEIDLVMEDSQTVVFVEVRYRSATNRLSAAESVDYRKQHKLTLTASWYLARNPPLQHRPVRFDVVAIDGRTTDRSALQWIKDAFRPGA